MDWFLYDNGHRHERIRLFMKDIVLHAELHNLEYSRWLVKGHKFGQSKQIKSFSLERRYNSIWSTGKRKHFREALFWVRPLSYNTRSMI